MKTYRAPAKCPVCSERLITLRVGCPNCATELSGHFTQCRYCSLDSSDARLLEVFLRGRGNLRDVQAELGVSYPTARQRLNDVLNRLGFGEPANAPAPPSEPAAARSDGTKPSTSIPDTAEVLARLAAGEISVDEAEAALSS